MHRLRLLFLVLLIGAGCSPAPPTTNPVDVISIASDFPLSGNFEAASLSEAVAFAIAQAPPVGRYHLAVRSFDDSLAGWPEPVKGVQNVERMLQDPSVVGMVGPVTSPMAAEEIPIASAGELAMVSPTTTSNCLTLKLPGCQLPPRRGSRNDFFRIAATDDSQGAAMADYALKTLHLTRVALLRDSHTSYGTSLVVGFSREFTAQGGTLTQNEVYQPGTNDFSEVLNRAAAAHAEAIYVGGVAPDGACRIRAQMAGILPDGYFLGGDGLIESSCIRDAGGMANDHMVATVAIPQPDLKDPRAKNYLKAHPNPEVTVFAAYDCALILADAIKRVVDDNHGRFPSRAQVLTAVATTSNLKGITGTWSFDLNGDATTPGVSFHRVQRRQWVLWK
jgi:branched-chain amino acid transport system substrate-binding protein